MVAPPLSDQTQRFIRLSVGSAVLTIGFAVLVLIGWAFDVTPLKRLGPQFVSMMPITAVGFILTGSAVLLLFHSTARPGQRIGQGFALLVALGGALIVVEYLVGLDLGIDRWLFPDAVARESTLYPGRPSLITGINFLLLGSALFGARTRARWLVTLPMIAICVSSGLAIIGYAYNVAEFYQIEFYGEMALNTALLFLVLAIALFAARPTDMPLATLLSPYAGGRMARLLLPAAILLPFTLGWLRLQGQRLGFYSTEFGLVLFAGANIVIFVGLIYWLAGVLNQTDQRRDVARAAVETSEQQLRQIFERFAGYVGLLTVDGVLLEVNEMPLVAAGLRREDVIGRPIATAPWWADMPESQAQLHAALQAARCGETVRYDTPIRLGGRIATVDLTFGPIYDREGQVMRLIGSAFDITEREQIARALHEQMRRTALLAEASHAFVAATQDQRQIVALIAHYSAAIFGDGAVVRLLSADGQSLECVAATHPDPALQAHVMQIAAAPMPLSHPWADQLVAERRTIVIPMISHTLLHAHTDPATWPSLAQIAIQSLVIVPLSVGDDLLGALFMARQAPHQRYTDDEVRLLEDLVDRASLALSNAHLLETIREYGRTQEQRVIERTGELQVALTRTETLYQISHTAHVTRDLPQLLQSTVDQVARALDADRVVVILVNVVAQQISQLVRGGPGSADVVSIHFEEFSEGLSGWVVRELQVAVSPKDQPDPRESPAVQQRRNATNCGAIMVAPLYYEGDVLGTITVIRQANQPDFAPDDRDMLQAIASQVVICIVNTQLLESLRENEAKLRTLFTVLPVGVFITNRESQVVDANPALERIFGRSREQLLSGGDTVLSALDAEGRALPLTALPNVRAQAEQRTIRDVEVGFVLSETETVWVTVSAAPLLEHQDGGVVVALTDISERKHAERVMATALREKEVLLKEIHHRVKNNLQIVSSLLRLQSETISDPSVQQMLLDSQRRVRSMALVHEQLYLTHDLAHINMGTYLTRLTHYLQRSAAQTSIAIICQVTVDEVLLSVDQAIPVGLVVNELVSNSLKHAFSGGSLSQGSSIWVVIGYAHGMYTLTVRDNGTGLHEAVDLNRPLSMGLQLVQSFALQLRGELTVQRQPGTTVTITFPERSSRHGKSPHPGR